MSVFWTRRAIKDIAKIGSIDRQRIEYAVDRFAETGAGDIRHLVDAKPPRYRLRIGMWRVIFIMVDEIAVKRISILRVLPRDKAYRG
jgi:mRNA-degrading endonuclease RelE of RelBE toxin-antitoxin system